MNPNIALILICIFLGGFLRLSGKFPKLTPQVLNGFVIWVSLPALVLIQVANLLAHTTLGPQLLIPVSMAWILFVLSYLFFSFVGKMLNWSKAQTGALVLTAGLSNTSFVGYPLLEALYGQEGLRVGVVVDQAGSFLVLSTLAILAAAFFSPAVPGEKRIIAFSSLAKNVYTFPPFIALILALVWHKSGLFGPGMALHVLEKLSSTLVPIALVAVGFQLKVSLEVLSRHWKQLCLGLAFKLVLSPLFFFVLYVFIFSAPGFSTKITILQSAMAPMITTAVVADQFGLDTEISNLMIGIGVPLSLLTVYAWNFVLT